jgi:hypothetical protein
MNDKRQQDDERQIAERYCSTCGIIIFHILVIRTAHVEPSYGRKKEAGYIIKVIKSSQGEPVGDEGEGEPNPQSAEDNEKEVAEALNKILSTLQECKIK